MLAMAVFAIPLVLPMLVAPFGGDVMLPAAVQAALAAIVQLIGARVSTAPPGTLCWRPARIWMCW